MSSIATDPTLRSFGGTEFVFDPWSNQTSQRVELGPGFPGSQRARRELEATVRRCEVALRDCGPSSKRTSVEVVRERNTIVGYKAHVSTTPEFRRMGPEITIQLSFNPDGKCLQKLVYWDGHLRD